MSEVGFVSLPGQGKPSPPRGDRIALLAGRQWGVVSRPQLLASGLGSGAVEHALATGRLRRLHRGVYVVGGGALCLEARWMAAVLACGPSAALSHRDAAALSELLRPPRRKLIDVTTAHGSRARRPGIDLHRTRHLPASSVTVVRGIATTTVDRTLLDLAEVAPARHLRRAVDEADRRGRLDRRELARLITRANGRHGLAGLRAILDRSGPPALTRSDLEERFLSLVGAVGLPPPLVNSKLHGLEVDFAWPDRRLVIEVDSYEFHRTRRRFETDRARDRRLTVAGHRVVRITEEALEHEPHAVEADLRLLL